MPKLKESVQRGSEIVNTSKSLQPLADYLLGELMIVDNLNTFVKKNRIAGWNIVDIEGNYSGNNLVLKNRQMSEHGNIIGREKKLEDIKKELESLSRKEHKIKKIELKHKSIDNCKNEINLLMKKKR